jgi:hypothetical protein
MCYRPNQGTAACGKHALEIPRDIPMVLVMYALAVYVKKLEVVRIAATSLKIS